MRQNLSAYLNKIIFGIILGVVVLTPLLFSPLTTEFFETPKLILIIVTVLVLFVLWSLSWVIEGKVILTRTPLDIPLILFLIVILVSTVLSDSRYISTFGTFPKLHGSAISWVSYILFYFIAVSNIKGSAHIKSLLYSLLAASVIISLITLFSYFSLFLPFNFAKVVSFTPAGSSFSATALLALLLPILTMSIIRPDRLLSPMISLVLATLFGVTIVLVGTPASQIVALVGVGLTAFLAKREYLKGSLYFLAIPVVISLIVLGLGFVDLGKKNPLMQKRVDFPREIQLEAEDSWKISSRAFSDKPFFGTGPVTYLFNFTNYKPITFNNKKYWNVKFDSAFNEYLQILGTLGILGLLAFLFLSAVIISFAAKGLKYQDNNLAFSLSVSALMGIALLLLHVSTLLVIVVLFTLLAVLMGLHKSGGGKVEELTLGIKASKIGNANSALGPMNNLVTGDVLPIILFIPVLVLVLIGSFQTYQAVAADVFHRKALNSADKKALDTYNYLVQAENLNPRVDLYRLDLAQTNFALANAIAINKGPSEASAAGSLNEDDRTNIRQLLSQSVSEAKSAVALSPRSTQNWQVLASIYRQISGVAQNALAFSLDAYGHAIAQDPLNPLLRLDVGGVYYSVKNYDLAVRFFSDAVNLKPDLANASYNLAVALRDKGSLTEAQSVAENVVRILQKDTSSPDYKTASDFLADLKARIATGSAKESNIVPPAAAQTGPLQKEQPKVEVEGLQNKPENIATPPAIKR